MSESCSVAGMASAGRGPVSSKRSPASRNKPNSRTALVNSSTNSGTPSVRSKIWSSSSRGSALPPLTRTTTAAPCDRESRVSESWVT